MGYLLNTSFVVEPKVHGQWYALVTDKFIPMLKEQQLFGCVTLSRVLSASVEQHYIYSILIDTETMEGYELYHNDLLNQYVEIAAPMFGEKATHFVSVMKKIEL